MRSALSILVLAALATTACRDRSAQPDADRDGFVAAQDCDDSDPAVHVAVTAYANPDGDELGAGPASSLCTADGLAPPGYALRDGDCAPADPAAWRAIANAPVDRDGDGFTVPTTVTLCVGDTLPEPYRADARGNDCDDDARPDRYRWVVLYRDQDGDGVGARPRTIVCLGAALPAGFAIAGFDPDDLDTRVTSAPLDDGDLARLLD